MQPKKIIFQPIHPFVLTQKFAENKACVSTDGKNTVITCDGNNPPKGYKSLYGKEGHTGIDLRAYHGQEVYAAQDGVVYHIDTNEKSGLDVRIEHTIGGERYRTIYEHLLGYQVKVGDTVRVGQLIGWSDNTGYSSGDHLHFELLKEDKKGNFVRVDPLTYMEPTFALTWLGVENKFLYLKEQVAKFLDNAAYKLRDSK